MPDPKRSLQEQIERLVKVQEAAAKLKTETVKPVAKPPSSPNGS